MQCVSYYFFRNARLECTVCQDNSTRQVSTRAELASPRGLSSSEPRSISPQYICGVPRVEQRASVVSATSRCVYLADGARSDPVTSGYEVVCVPHVLCLLGLHLHEAIAILTADLPPQHLHAELEVSPLVVVLCPALSVPDCAENSKHSLEH